MEIKIKIKSKYGEWTVVERIGSNKDRNIEYRCSCIRGHMRIIIATLLKRRRKRPICMKCRRENVTGGTFHNWKILNLLGEIFYEKGHGHACYLVQHICGNERTTIHIESVRTKGLRCWKCDPKKGTLRGIDE